VNSFIGESIVGKLILSSPEVPISCFGPDSGGVTLVVSGEWSEMFVDCLRSRTSHGSCFLVWGDVSESTSSVLAALSSITANMAVTFVVPHGYFWATFYLDVIGKIWGRKYSEFILCMHNSSWFGDMFVAWSCHIEQITSNRSSTINPELELS